MANQGSIAASIVEACVLNSFHHIDFIHFFDLKSVEKMLTARIR
jgi:hypothetical protein